MNFNMVIFYDMYDNALFQRIFLWLVYQKVGLCLSVLTVSLSKDSKIWVIWLMENEKSVYVGE